eukprot:TRINITY_DN19419_c0_g1_i1.p1 TRINITY_DN19419_c0_g1~~TRINITY_DN19419_c0_g1_i1.p1  ORF type:complete len:193 (+),score=22.02 TRINITY_DN19419_c0_g1_i1:69-581(+)
MADGAVTVPYVQGAWGKGPEHPHAPARPKLQVEPELTTFTRNLHWEATTRASSQAALDKYYAKVAAQNPAITGLTSPFAKLPNVVTNPANPYASTRQEPESSSPKWDKSWGTMSRAASAPQINLAQLVRTSRNLHSYVQPEKVLRATGWKSMSGTASQFFKPKPDVAHPF